jgi:DNA processing protein
MIEYWIWLSQIPYIGPITANVLVKTFGSPERIYNAGSQEIADTCHITKKQLDMIMKNRSMDKANEIIDKCNVNNINILTMKDTLYPLKSKEHDAPIVLYYKGNLKQLDKTVGIVGARRCTREARMGAITKAKEYTLRGYTVISGMAKGVDAYAHTSCLKSGGYTIAMLANGLDICYPKEHDLLMESIIENGLVLSEYPPGVKPSQYMFPIRNRLISAWSDEVVVIGAGRGSGAIITAEYAEKYGKKVIMMPYL